MAAPFTHPQCRHSPRREPLDVRRALGDVSPSHTQPQPDGVSRLQGCQPKRAQVLGHDEQRRARRAQRVHVTRLRGGEGKTRGVEFEGRRKL